MLCVSWEKQVWRGVGLQGACGISEPGLLWMGHVGSGLAQDRTPGVVILGKLGSAIPANFALVVVSWSWIPKVEMEVSNTRLSLNPGGGWGCWDLDPSHTEEAVCHLLSFRGQNSHLCQDPCLGLTHHVLSCGQVLSQYPEGSVLSGV